MTQPRDVRDRLKLNITPELYDAIRALWVAHSKAEDARDLDGLIATLSQDCVYEIVGTDLRWEGHEGARTFYTTLLSAFPDVDFDLQDIVIGPQGVFEVANMTATFTGEWQGVQGVGQRIETTIMIYFPWDAAAEKFSGEKIYVDTNALTQSGS
ncbi:MAG: hypothetical protein D6737_18085 [Chloroflexi bacterium]|nr:MAG: hypothetical protein D6737_18085 [Chloroflexota bacterium]